MNFKYLMENKSIWIGDGELIVGERGPKPKATPTYPEICIHSTDDLEIFNTREKVSFAVSDETKKLYEDRIIPFWQGKSIREKIFCHVPDKWKQAYEAGIFTEFQEPNKTTFWFIRIRVIHVLNANLGRFCTKNSKVEVFITAPRAKKHIFNDSLNGKFVVI